MKALSSSPEAVVIVKWPQSVPALAAREAARRLAEARVPATWSVESAAQLGDLASWSPALRDADAALILADAAAPEQTATRELARRLDLLRSAGAKVTVLHGGPELASGHWPRTLRSFGVHAVVVEGAAEAGSSRALPFGVWQFSPQDTAPRVPHWSHWFRPKRKLFSAKQASPVVVTLDLARAGAAGSRGWREVEAVISQASQIRSDGTMALVTMGELAARLNQANAPRPQRSILRAA
jgi:hypothetical protein